ncbi:Protein FAR1-RELATED SEQUENCE 5 [Linum grandiflorum]
MDYFCQKQLEDSSYFHSVQFDDDNFILNMFWADGRSIVDYKHFGDVVYFDTTYKTNGYGRPFAPFVGVNHMKQTIIFGAALLYDETVSSFKWLFETFLTAIGRKQPKTILTDQSAAMTKAIKEVFIKTNHRLCVWHIYQNAAKHLSHVFHGSKQFTSDFSSCVYDYEDEDEWLTAWNNILKKYNLENNEWLHGIFSEKEKWAMVYGRFMFIADMKSTQRSESMNNVLKKYLKPKHNMLYFFDHYSRLVEDRRYQELLAEFKMRDTRLLLKVDVDMLRHASRVYPHKVFNMFQEEYVKALDWTIDKISKNEDEVVYKVRHIGGNTDHRVQIKPALQMVKCSCMKFNFVGILCAHALKALKKKNIKQVPEHYLLKRWKRDAKDGDLISSTAVHGSSEKSIGKRYFNLNYNFQEISTIVIEDDTMYDHAYGALSKLLKELKEMRKCQSIQNSTDINIQDTEASIEVLCSNQEPDYHVVAGVKTKTTVGQPKGGRYKGALERSKSQHAQSKSQITITKLICIQRFYYYIRKSY